MWVEENIKSSSLLSLVHILKLKLIHFNAIHGFCPSSILRRERERKKEDWKKRKDENDEKI